MAVTCPTFEDYNPEELCLENFGGVDPFIYVGIKSDLSAPMTATDGVTYTTPAFSPGKGLYKITCKSAANNITGESQGPNKGFKLNFNFVVQAVNEKLAKLSRAFNNNDIFLINPDGEHGAQLMYHPTERVKFESGGIKSETGSAATDERQTSFSASLEKVLYQNLYVTAPEGGFDTLLASASKKV